MNDKNKITVRIMDQEYTLASEDSGDYMKALAEFVEGTMTGIAKGNQKLSPSILGVLAALTIADDLKKVTEERDELQRRLESPEYDLARLQKELETVREAYDERMAFQGELMDALMQTIRTAQSKTKAHRIMESRMRHLDADLNSRTAAIVPQEACDDLDTKTKGTLE